MKISRFLSMWCTHNNFYHADLGMLKGDLFEHAKGLLLALLGVLDALFQILVDILAYVLMTPPACLITNFFGVTFMHLSKSEEELSHIHQRNHKRLLKKHYRGKS